MPFKKWINKLRTVKWVKISVKKDFWKIAAKKCNLLFEIVPQQIKKDKA